MEAIEEAYQRLQQAYLAAGFAAISGEPATVKAAFAAHEDAALALASVSHDACCAECRELLHPRCPVRARITALGP